MTSSGGRRLPFPVSAWAEALSAITAAVVGVILNLGVKFSIHALWPAGHFDWFTAAVALAAFVAMQRFKLGLIPTIGACAVLGLVWKLAT